MGACTSQGTEVASKDALPNETELAAKANKAMGKEKDLRAGIKLLLLGAGGSGKTTFRKQLRSIYSGYSDAMRHECAALIVDNMFDGIKVLRNECKNRGLVLDEAAEAALSRLVKPSRDAEFLTPEQAADMNAVWASALVVDMVKERQKFHLQECVVSYFEQLKTYPAWGGAGYVPSVDDCIRARVRSSGVVEEPITVDGVTFLIFDAGGQRSERRKWIHYFDKVNAILYVASLTAYAENLYEDSTQNNLVESLSIFENLANSKWFSNTPILHFLNKRDLFEQLFVQNKIPLNMSGYFPTAPDTEDADVAIGYFLELYSGRRRVGPHQDLSSLLYTHVTTAIDRSNVQTVFDTSKAIILKQSLATSGFSI